MNSKTIIAIVAVAVVVIAAIALAVSGGNGGNDDNDGKTVTVVDAAGREVKVNIPVEKVAILEPTAIEVFAGAVGDGWEKYVVLISKDIETREATKWSLLLEKYPGLKNVTLAGDVYGSGGIPSEDVIASEATLVLVSDPTISFIPGVESQIEALEKMGIATLYIGFYDKAFTDGIAEKNYGAIGEVMGTTDVSDKIVDLYNEKVKYVKDQLKTIPTKNYSYFVEMPMEDGSYGQVVSMGTPEFKLLGGSNICTAPEGYDAQWNLEKMQRPDGNGPDFIFLVNTGYFGNKAIMGHNVHPSAEDCQEMIDSITKRSGWSDITAVKNGNVALIYGELRNSAFGLVDLYNAATVIYPELFTQEDVDKLIEELDSLTPFGFDGTWMYKTTATAGA